MVGWHHGLSGHEFKQAPGDGEGQGSLACCSPWGSQRVRDDLLNNNYFPLILKALSTNTWESKSISYANISKPQIP